jgi:hypothetical protein
MAPYDYTDAPSERELIPAGTVATLRIHVRPGNVGEDGMLKRSKAGDCEMLGIEYLVVDGPTPSESSGKIWSWKAPRMDSKR